LAAPLVIALWLRRSSSRFGGGARHRALAAPLVIALGLVATALVIAPRGYRRRGCPAPTPEVIDGVTRLGHRWLSLPKRKERSMTDIATVIETYIESWNETDPASRRELIGRTFADDATYVDPLMSGEGPDEIAAMIGAAQDQFPDHRFELSFGPEEHNGRVRFAWILLGTNGGEAVAAGVDFATLAEDGRLRTVTGFLEPAAAA
jgi:SnoaL-like domain